MERKRVLFLVDFKYRDLPGLVLVKLLLEAKGPYEVTLAPHVSTVGEQIYLNQYRPHLVVLPYFINPRHAARARRLQQLGVGVAVMPTEGTALVEEVREQLAGRFVDLSHIDLFFMWNETIADLAEKHGTISSLRRVVAGVPRFDFYHPRFHSLMPSRESFCQQHGLDADCKIVTWATNFGLVPFANKPHEMRNLIQRHRQEGLGDSKVCGNIPDLIERELSSRRVQTEETLWIAKNFPKVQLVIKVHPAEEASWYRHQVKMSGLKNVRVIHRDYIWNTLNQTDLHLHRSCTTAIEAWLLNKPTIDLQFSPREWYFSADLSAGGEVARSREEFHDQVNHYLEGGGIGPAQQKARLGIIEWFCGGVDGLSSERHAEALHQWFSKTRRQPIAPVLDQDGISSRFKRQIKSVLGLKPYHSFWDWIRGKPLDPREKYFSEEDIRYWTQGIQSILQQTEVLTS